MKHEKFMAQPLGKYNSKRPYAKYYYNQEEAPQSLWDELGDLSPVDSSAVLKIQDRNRLLEEGYLQTERGWAIFPDGTGTCAGYLEFPNATPEMMAWWFSWFPCDDLRGKLWEPKNHLGSMITEEEFNKLTDYSKPVKERTWGVHFFPLDCGVRPEPGAEKAPIRIQFYSPADFGMDIKRIEEMGEDFSIICAQVGPVGLSQTTSFIHTCRKTQNGMELRSRFWYGWVFENGEPIKAKMILPKPLMENNCKSQMVHLIEEYYNLSRILPQIYFEFKDVPDKFDDYR